MSSFMKLSVNYVLTSTCINYIVRSTKSLLKILSYEVWTKYSVLPGRKRFCLPLSANQMFRMIIGLCYVPMTSPKDLFRV